MAESLTDELKDMSFRNMVDFYQDELRQIMEGQNAKQVLSITVRATMSRNKILKRGGGKGNQLTVTPEAKSILSYRENIERGG